MATVEVIAVPDLPDNPSSCVYYPLWFARLKASWKRLLVSKRVESFWTCVDGARALAYRVDTRPETVSITPPGDALIPLSVDRDAAVGKAMALAKSWTRARLFSWWPAELELEDLSLIYRPYLITGGRDAKSVMDLITGEREKL
jgi:hypothetical protein